MAIDIELAKVGVTVLGTFATTMIAVGKFFHGNICNLSLKIADLSDSIAALDKNLAVQTAMFKQHMKDSHENRSRNHLL